MSKKNSKGKQDEVEYISQKEKVSLANTSTVQEIYILNENNEKEMINFSSDEMLENVQIEDSTVEVIGFLDEIEGPKIVGKAQHYRLLKFMLNNNSRHRIQVVVWNNEIERVQHHIQPNKIIHIDGAKARRPKVTDFNHGTLPYELIIYSNTIINNLGTFDLKTKINTIQPQVITFEKIPEYLNSLIIVCGYIKTSFNTLSTHYKTCGYGSLTDGTHKLEIQITNYENEDYFKKGEQVEVKGYVKVANDIFYLEVDNILNIKLLKGKMTFAECLKGTKPIIKRASNSNEKELPNKMTRI